MMMWCVFSIVIVVITVCCSSCSEQNTFVQEARSAGAGPSQTDHPDWVKPDGCPEDNWSWGCSQTNQVDYTWSTILDWRGRVNQAESTSVLYLCQINETGAAKRPLGQEFQVSQNEMRNCGQVNQIEEMSFTREGQCKWRNQILLAY